MKKIKLLLTILAVSLISVSCLVDDETATGYDLSPYLVGFDDKTATNSYFADEGVVTKEYSISLLGGGNGALSPNEIAIDFSVNPASTATEGVEFDFPVTGSLIMSANSRFVQFPLDINTGNFDPDAPTSLIIDLTTNSTGSQISALSSSIEIKFVGCLATADLDTYDLTYDYINLDGDLFPAVNAGIEGMALYEGIPNNFITESTPPWGPGQLAPGYDGYIFSVICGEVFITTQNLGGYWGNTVEGIAGSTNSTGVVDEITGDITIDYVVCFAGDCRQLFTNYVKQ